MVTIQVSCQSVSDFYHTEGSEESVRPHNESNQSDNKNFVDGVAIPDARIGVKATYGKYKAKVDIGYAYGKVSLKDIFVERQFSSHALLRVGNYFLETD